MRWIIIGSTPKKRFLSSLDIRDYDIYINCRQGNKDIAEISGNRIEVSDSGFGFSFDFKKEETSRLEPSGKIHRDLEYQITVMKNEEIIKTFFLKEHVYPSIRKEVES